MSPTFCRLAFALIVAVSVAGASATAWAELLARESFDYDAGSLTGSSTGSSNGGSGWGGPWKAAGGAARVGPHQADVAVADGGGYFGNQALLDGNTRVGRILDVSSSGPFAAAGLVESGRIGKDGTTLYVGFMQHVSEVPGSRGGSFAKLRYYSFEFNAGESDTVRVLEIGHDDRSQPKPNKMYGAASVINNGRSDKEPGQFQSLGKENTAVNFIVVKFTFGPDNNDTVQVFRNPRGKKGPGLICRDGPKGASHKLNLVPFSPDATLKGNFQFDRIALARFVGNTPVHAIDEIRFATQYSDVFPPVDEERLKAVEAETKKQIEQTLDALAAKGIDVADRRRQLSSIAAPTEQSSPWKRLQALRVLKKSMELAGTGLVVDKLLFVKRHAYKPTHIYTEYSDGPYRPGGGIFILSPVRPDGKLTMLFDAKGGICRDPELSFDCRRVLFSYRPNEQEGYHIYEMNIDGSGLRQLTSGPYDDMDPLYLPDGRIAFTSTRCESRVLCFWPQAATLFAMNADGSGIRRLTSNNVNEFTPDLLPDGRILYTRWEYMDKSAIFVQSLWSTSPDGTRAQQIFGNNLIHPVSFLQARLIPGTKKIVCILGRHNGDSVGMLAVVDPTLGVNNPDGILNLTPDGRYHVGCFSPYPLSEKWCLVSYGPQEPFGLYAFSIDPPPEKITPRKAQDHQPAGQWPKNPEQCWSSAIGRRHLIYRDNKYSCVEPIPITRRHKPPLVASSLPRKNKSEDNRATLVLADVYRGLGGAVKRGRIKYLRVVEEMGHFDWQRGGNINGFMNRYAAPWESKNPAPSLQAKHVFGTVPVEPDGSAHFHVPSGRPIYFQALDADFNEIQRMRSYIHLMPGERQSCIGCHEPRHTAPPAGSGSLAALHREPSDIQPPPWGAGPFCYQRLVQPVLDKHCAACHATDKPAGGLNLSAKRDGRGAPASFASLVRPRTDPNRPPLVHFFDSWWGVSRTVPVAEPLSFGTAASRMIEMIDTRHEGVEMKPEDRARIKLSPAERRVITTWIDLNCPLWSNYARQYQASLGVDSQR